MLRPKGALAHEPDHQSKVSGRAVRRSDDRLHRDPGDIFSHLHNNEPTHARRLHRRFAAELQLLDDLGWEQEPDVDEFELTMPARELRPIIERVYWSAVASLNNDPGELVDEAVEHLSDATVACPEILARLADDLIAPEQGVGCADAPTAAA